MVNTCHNNTYFKHKAVICQIFLEYATSSIMLIVCYICNLGGKEWTYLHFGAKGFTSVTLRSLKLHNVHLGPWLLPHLFQRHPHHILLMEPLNLIPKLPQSLDWFLTSFFLYSTSLLKKVLMNFFVVGQLHRSMCQDILNFLFIGHHYFYEGTVGLFPAWVFRIVSIWFKKSHVEDRMYIESYRELKFISDIPNSF